jgi:uncharacterized protein (DUF433 family)
MTKKENRLTMQIVKRFLVVGISGLDSKNYDVVIQFKKSLENQPHPLIPVDILSDGAQKVNEYGEVEVRRIRQVQKQLMPAEVDEIVKAYKAGNTTYALAEQFGCQRVTISEHLKKRGVNVSKRKSMDKLDVDDVIFMYRNMHTSQKIAEKYGVHPQVVIRCLRAEGIAIRGRWDY